MTHATRRCVSHPGVFLNRRDNLVHHYGLHLDITGLVLAYQLTEKVDVGVTVEHSRIIDGLICEEYAERQQHHGTQPHAFPHLDFAVTRHFLPRVVDDVIEDKQEH